MVLRLLVKVTKIIFVNRLPEILCRAFLLIRPMCPFVAPFLLFLPTKKCCLHLINDLAEIELQNGKLPKLIENKTKRKYNFTEAELREKLTEVEFDVTQNSQWEERCKKILQISHFFGFYCFTKFEKFYSLKFEQLKYDIS